MCSFKTLVKFGLGLGVLLAVGYVVFPQYQATIRAIAPIFLILACPLAMYFGMKDMKPHDERKTPRQDDK
ncbi:DUF2933 family protein [Cupriavidus metallidurans]